MIDLGTWLTDDAEAEDSTPADHDHDDDLKKRGLLN
jgi:hypothetical protein